MIKNLSEIKAQYEVRLIIATLKDFRAKHVEDYGIALAEYNKAKLAAAEKAVKELRKGKDPVIHTNFSLIQPVDCKVEYDKLITIFNHMVDTHVELDTDQANSIFNDDWSWINNAKMSNFAYSAGSTYTR